MSDIHQATDSGSSSPTTSTTSTNGAAPPPAAFYEGFADKSLAANPTIQKFTGVEDMAKSYLTLQTRFGIDPARRIDLPEDMTNEEAMRGVWSKLGMPEKAEGYNLKLPDGATAEDNALLGKYIEQAHRVGLPTGQAKAMADWWFTLAADALKQQTDATQQRKLDGETALKQAFGNAFDNRMREARLLLQRYDPEGKTGLTPDNLTLFPQWTQMLIRMSDRMAEPEGGLGGQSDDSGRPLTPAQAQARLTEFNLDAAKQEALFDEKHPAHKAVLGERTRLLEAANPRPGPAR